MRTLGRQDEENNLRPNDVCDSKANRQLLRQSEHSMTEMKPIRFLAKGTTLDTGHEGAAQEILGAQFLRLTQAISPGMASLSQQRALTVLQELSAMADDLDQQYGPDGNLALDDIEEVTNAGLTASAELEGWVNQTAGDTSLMLLDNLTLGLTLWAMRHHVNIAVSEPIVNALARRVNLATSKQETAAVFAMTQGTIEHLRPQLERDLERSNPERPWRLLNVNFAIASIRTGDTALMRFAFDQFNLALPDECAGFYAEALSVADRSGLPADTRTFIADECRRWTAVH